MLDRCTQFGAHTVYQRQGQWEFEPFGTRAQRAQAESELHAQPAQYRHYGKNAAGGYIHGEYEECPSGWDAFSCDSYEY